MKKKKTISKVFSLMMSLAVVTACIPTGVGAAAAETKSGGQAINGVVYATVDMPYADFYYGETNDIAAKTTGLTGTEKTADLTDADPVEGNSYRGNYDAVTSATSQKSKGFPTTYYEDHTIGAAEGTVWSDPDHPAVTIKGISAVQVAIPEDLYNDIKTKMDNKGTCSNKLFDFVENMKFSDTAFSEYKVLQNDGTFSKMKTETTNDTDASASISTDSVWGTHQISFTNMGTDNDAGISSDDVLGAIIETSDNLKFGMVHLDNIWLRTNELSFAVKSGFKEPHGNMVNYKAHTALEGKIITKVTYMLKNKTDVIVNCSLKVRTLLSDSSKITAKADSFKTTDSIKTKFDFANIPAGADYEVKSVTSNAGQLGTEDYTYKTAALDADKELTINNKKPGSYTVLFSDANNEYEDTEATFSVASTLTGSDIKASDNKLSISGDGITLADYLANVTSVTVNGTKISASGIGKMVFDDNGNIDFTAKTPGGHGQSGVEIFPNGSDCVYSVTVSADGYPDAVIAAGKASAAASISKAAYTYTGKVIKPAVTVKDTAGKTISSANYTISYTSSILPGRYSVTAVLKAPYTGTKTMYYTISPAKNSVKLSKAKKNSFKAGWSKAVGVTGYEARYSTSSKFKKAKTVSVSSKVSSKTITKLKKNKKYYVQTRSYKTYKIGSKSYKLYSAWSSSKSIKTKKK